MTACSSISIYYIIFRIKTQIKMNNPITQRMISLHHTHNPTPNQCTSSLVQIIKAPLPLVWSILRRFDQPQVYKTFIKNCTMLLGTGDIGSVREVEIISDMPAKVSVERLDRLDDEMHVMMFTMIQGGDHRLLNYQSTATVNHEEEGGGGGTVVVESYLVDVPPGNTEEETRIFVNTLVGCNHRSLAIVAERLACNV
ncbi:hypothetical protein ACJIZ3_013274 [Penstemon smallii]|uniref:Uncharacterized protein n=1 Tax=Penstemon smallii TaxID=265156 RepID=A0ABD3UT07_9LAMI